MDILVRTVFCHTFMFLSVTLHLFDIFKIWMFHMKTRLKCFPNHDFFYYKVKYLRYQMELLSVNSINFYNLDQGELGCVGSSWLKEHPREAPIKALKLSSLTWTKITKPVRRNTIWENPYQGHEILQATQCGATLVTSVIYVLF